MTHLNASTSWIAYRGGSEPKNFHDCNELEINLINALNKAQIEASRAFWGKEPDQEMRRIFWNRARHDAHATCRAGCMEAA